jgi:hypothetical protein
VAGHLPLFTDEDVTRWGIEGRAFDADEPITAREPKTFGHLAEESRIPEEGGGLRGKRFWPRSRPTCTTWGLIFGWGLPTALPVPVRGLSRMLNHFFAEYSCRHQGAVPRHLRGLRRG